MGVKRKTSHKNLSKVYSKGQINFAVDAIVHPFAEKNPVFIVLDVALHTLVEADIKVSAQKFVKYTVPYILKKYAKKRG